MRNHPINPREIYILPSCDNKLYISFRRSYIIVKYDDIPLPHVSLYAISSITLCFFSADSLEQL